MLQEITKVKEIIEKAEIVMDIPIAYQFASSVRNNAESIAKTIEKSNNITEKQREALNNMEQALDKWIH